MAGRGVRFHLQSEGRAALVPTSSHPADMLVRKLGSIARLSDEERPRRHAPAHDDQAVAWRA